MDISKINALLVDDDNNTRISIKSMLQEMGLSNIREAKDGQEALSAVDQSFSGTNDPIDLIICDWNMPHKTGISFLREVRQLDTEIPFLMITARADQESVQTAINDKVTAYIRKPFNFDQLKTKVFSALKGRYDSIDFQESSDHDTIS